MRTIIMTLGLAVVFVTMFLIAGSIDKRSIDINNMWNFRDLCTEGGGIPLEMHIDSDNFWIDNYELRGCSINGNIIGWDVENR